jgi:hypothetical protein
MSKLYKPKKMTATVNVSRRRGQTNVIVDKANGASAHIAKLATKATNVTHQPISDVPGEEKGFANSGIQYRSKVVKPEYCIVASYQADMESGKTYSGILNEEIGRGILTKRGQKVVLKEGAPPNKPKIKITGSVGDSNKIQAAIKLGGWNDYVIIAKGNHLQQFINGKPTVDAPTRPPSVPRPAPSPSNSTPAPP